MGNLHFELLISIVDKAEDAGIAPKCGRKTFGGQADLCRANGWFAEAKKWWMEGSTLCDHAAWEGSESSETMTFVPGANALTFLGDPR